MSTLLALVGALVCCLAISCHAQSNPRAYTSPQPYAYQEEAKTYDENDYEYESQPEKKEKKEEKKEKKKSGGTNLFDNLWKITSQSLSGLSEENKENNPDLSNALDLFLDTAGGVGADVAEFDESRTRDKGTLDGLTGFFNNVADAGSRKIGTTIETAMSNVTSNAWFQNKVVDGVTNMMNTGPADPNGGLC